MRVGQCGVFGGGAQGACCGWTERRGDAVGPTRVVPALLPITAAPRACVCMSRERAVGGLSAGEMPSAPCVCVVPFSRTPCFAHASLHPHPALVALLDALQTWLCYCRLEGARFQAITSVHQISQRATCWISSALASESEDATFSGEKPHKKEYTLP